MLKDWEEDTAAAYASYTEKAGRAGRLLWHNCSSSDTAAVAGPLSLVAAVVVAKLTVEAGRKLNDLELAVAAAEMAVAAVVY